MNHAVSRERGQPSFRTTVKPSSDPADHANTMACHQHRLCRPAPSPVADVNALDYVLLAAHDAGVLDSAAAVLRNAGVAPERHDLGFRINGRGDDWTAALGHLYNAFSPTARRNLRVALIPVTANALAFQKALLSARPLDAFVPWLAARAVACAPADGHFLSDVFKGESLE